MSGTAFALAAGALLATTLLLLKGAVHETPPLTVVSYVYGFAAIWHALYYVARGAPRWRARTAIAGGLLGILDGTYNVALLSGLALLGSAAHGFYTLLGELCAVVLGVIILGERYSRREVLAWLAVLAGAGIVRAHAGGDGAGLAWMVFCGLAFATSAIATRRLTRTHAPADLLLARTACVAIVLCGSQLARGIVPPPEVLVRLAVVGFLGPFLTGLCIGHALQRLEVGRVVSLRLSYAVLVPIGAWICFGAAPATRELVGGAVMLAGCLVMVREREALTRRVAPSTS